MMHLSGSSPLGMYKKLVEFCNRGELSFKYVKTFNMDEYVRLDRDHPESYHSFMWENFFKHIDIDPKNAHILDGNAEDLVAECDSYEEKITQAGGIDLFIGGTVIFHIKLQGGLYISRSSNFGCPLGVRGSKHWLDKLLCKGR